MKYRLVVNRDSKSFQAEVNRAMSAGYKPYGKLKTKVWGGYMYYIRELVKED